MRPPSRQSTRKKGIRGQATAEIVAALIGLAAIFGGVIQIAQLGDAAAANMLDARTDAMRNAGNVLQREGGSISDWETGPDGLNTTSDDIALSGNYTVTDPMIGELFGGAIAPGDAAVHDWMSPELGYGAGFAANLYVGEADRQVPVEHTLKKLLGLNDFLEIRDQVYLPGLRIDATETQP